MAAASLNSIGPFIATALQLEESGNPPAVCYYEYIRCLKNILDILFSDSSYAQTNQSWDADRLYQHAKILKLASNCMERASSKINSITISHSQTSQSSSLPPKMTHDSPEYVATHTKSLSKSLTNSYDVRQNEMNNVGRLPTAIESPTDVALKRNKLLTEAFQKKVQSGKFTYSQLSQMRLTLQRNLTENLRIAKSKESSFGKEIEKNISIQQALIERQRSRYDVLYDVNNFGLYKSSVSFEFHFLTNDQWYQRLKPNKSVDTHLTHCFIYLLKLNEHPLRMHLNDLISKTEREFLSIDCSDPELSQTTFFKISQNFMNELQNIARIFAILLIDKDQSQPLLDSLEKFVFNGPFTPTVMDVLHKCNSSGLEYFQQIINMTSTEQADLVGLKEEFCFYDDPTAFNLPIQELLRLLQFNSPCEKIFHLTAAITSLIEYLRDKMPHGQKGIGADELLPALCFVLVKSKNLELIVHCKFLEAFISDDKIEGTDGYTLTTFISAVTFCSSRL